MDNQYIVPLQQSQQYCKGGPIILTLILFYKNKTKQNKTKQNKTTKREAFENLSLKLRITDGFDYRIYCHGTCPRCDASRGSLPRLMKNNMFESRTIIYVRVFIPGSLVFQPSPQPHLSHIAQSDSHIHTPQRQGYNTHRNHI